MENNKQMEDNITFTLSPDGDLEKIKQKFKEDITKYINNFGEEEKQIKLLKTFTDMSRIFYRKLSNKFNNIIVSKELKKYIENDINIVKEEEIDEEDKDKYISKEEVDIDEVLDNMYESECVYVLYDKNRISEFGEAFDMGLEFVNKEKDIKFCINYTYINENDIYYEVSYNEKNMSKIFNFVDFVNSIKDKLEVYD